jgi:hypothetical protein
MKAIVISGHIEVTYHSPVLKKHTELSLITSLKEATLKMVREVVG